MEMKSVASNSSIEMYTKINAPQPYSSCSLPYASSEINLKDGLRSEIARSAILKFRFEQSANASGP